MVEWTARKPNRTLTLDEVTAACRTAPAKRLAEIYQGWMAAAPDGLVPNKSAMDIVSLAPVMTDLMLFAITGDDRCLCRLAGESVQRQVASRLVGRNYYDVVPRERLDSVRRAMRMVIERPCGYRSEIAQRLLDDRDRILESLALPLASSEPGVDGFMLITVAPIVDEGLAWNGDVVHGGVNIALRDLIDLGFGVDETFVDYFPA